jgi:hypothetical protein
VRWMHYLHNSVLSNKGLGLFSIVGVSLLHQIPCLADVNTETRSRVSSGSIVSDYGLDDRAIGVRSPAGAKDFSSILCVQTGSVAHPASFPMGTGGPFPGSKARPGRDADQLTPI